MENIKCQFKFGNKIVWLWLEKAFQCEQWTNANRLDMETISEKKEKVEEAYKSNLRNVFVYLSSVITRYSFGFTGSHQIEVINVSLWIKIFM